MTLIRILAGASLALAAPFGLAQSQAPGLWEQTVQMKGGDGAMERAQAQMQQQMAALPPEQRKAIEQAMSKSNVSFGPQGTTVRICVTREQAARPVRPQINGTDCTFSGPQRSGSTYKYSYACTRPTRSSGEGEMTFDGDKSYKGTMQVTGEEPGGAAARTTMQIAARWLGADCGAVKPLSVPPSVPSPVR